MDKLIIGAGLYGLYAALYCGKRGQQVEVLEIEQAPFTRATYINQASFLRRAFCAVCGIFRHACGTGRPPGDAEHADPAVIPLYDLSRGSQRPCGG